MCPSGLARTNSKQLNRELRRELHLTKKPPGYIVPIELAGGSRERYSKVPPAPDLRVLN